MIEVEKKELQKKLPYALVQVTPGIADTLKMTDTMPLFSGDFIRTTHSVVGLGAGDVVALTVFESGSGGLFIPSDAGSRPGNFVQIPSQQVQNDGTIAVPYAGRMRVAGLTPVEVGRQIDARLANRALEPQTVVSVNEHRSNIISVVGDVQNSVRFSMDPGGERVLGAIARAGGPRFPTYESYVTIQRGNSTQHAWLSALATAPEQNIQLLANDTVYVSHLPRYFISLGATGNGQTLGPINRRFPFEDTTLSLADALGKAGGLQDDRANPSAVFLFRYEARQVLERIFGVAQVAQLPAQVPTIYRVDMSRPDGFFFANTIPMHHEDIIFVGNAPSTDLSKFLALVLPASYSAANFSTGIH